MYHADYTPRFAVFDTGPHFHTMIIFIQIFPGLLGPVA